MKNPFEDDELQFYALVNEEAQYSLWPSFCDVPGGWTVELGPATRAECLAHIEAQWTDMRPLSIRQSMEAAERERSQATAQPAESGGDQ